jgi:acyl-CoA hydrolase
MEYNCRTTQWNPFCVCFDSFECLIMIICASIGMASPLKPGKRPAESQAEMTIIMLPTDANPKGNVFGGVILKHVDLIAGLVAKRHSGRANTVTASIDRMTFLKPVFIGNALILTARLNYVRKSSMEVEVTVMSEDLDDGTRIHAGTAFVTMVALDKYGKATEVPQIILDSAEEKSRFKEGELRMLSRLKEAGRI